MSSFLHSVSAVLIILLLTGVGFYCAHRDFITEDGKGMLSKILLNICIPCMIIHNFQTSFTKESLLEASRGILASFLILALLFLLAFLAIRIMRLPRKQTGVFVTLAAASNAMFVGYPMCVELFGEACIPHVMAFYLADTLFVQILCCGSIRFSGESGKFFSRDMLKKLITTPAIVTIFFALTLLLLNIRLPEFLLTTVKYFSNCVTPLALLITGYILHSIGLKSLRLDRTLTVAMLFRFVLSPLFGFLFCRLFGIEGLLRSVIMAECAMPSPTQTVVFASEYKADDVLAARGCSLFTLLSFVEMPILMLILSAL